MATLVLLRHGESAWNAADVFTGWIDVRLSDRGKQQAHRAGQLLAARGQLPDIVHTSVQTRAIQTADLALAPCGRTWIPVRRSWRLNSNHYGALQGRAKAEVRAEAGEEQYMRWRRGYRVRPPQGEPDKDPRYAALPPEARPRGESLHDVTRRLLPYWYDAIVPDLRRYGCVLVVSHGNTLRALIKHLEAVSDDAVSALEVPNATPLCYQFHAGQPGGRASDPLAGRSSCRGWPFIPTALRSRGVDYSQDSKRRWTGEDVVRSGISGSGHRRLRGAAGRQERHPPLLADTQHVRAFAHRPMAARWGVRPSGVISDVLTTPPNARSRA